MRGSPVTDLSHLQQATNQNVRFGIEKLPVVFPKIRQSERPLSRKADIHGLTEECRQFLI